MFSKNKARTPKHIPNINAGNIIFGPEGKDKYLENINTIWFNHKKIDVCKKLDLNEVTKFKQILELV